ncbi:MAG TPA: DUF4350 domain-containing protein [Kofleriaceae bacterium]|nr:DUF4350 domain-containing protein [Kofleriaceae bacterium]
MNRGASGFGLRASGFAIACVLLASGSARADPSDYDPMSHAWNGMADFVSLARGDGLDIDAVSTLEWDSLGADDILFLVYPLQRVDPGRLSAFVQAGGQVVIADDFGESKDALAALGLLRADVGTPHASRYFGNHLFAPIATPRLQHPLTEGVGDVVTNHPAVLRDVQGATEIVGFDDGAVVVAGERGTGRFVAVSDPSIFINQMQRVPGNLQLATNILRWLRRGEHAHVTLLRGDVPMYGEPKPFIYDPHGGAVGHDVAELNQWLFAAHEWLLTATAMKALAAALAAALLVLAMIALPVRRGPKIDGAWLRFGRPARRDEPHGLVASAERDAQRTAVTRGRDAQRTALGSVTRGRGAAPLLVIACMLRDQVQAQLAAVTGRSEPLFTLPEAELVALVSNARGTPAGVALARVHRRLRALPSRSQAAAPWSASSTLARRDFDTLYRDVAELCRTLGAPLSEAA